MKKILGVLLSGAGLAGGYFFVKKQIDIAYDKKNNAALKPADVKALIQQAMFNDEQKLTKDKFLPTAMSDVYANLYVTAVKADLQKVANTLSNAGYTSTSQAFKNKIAGMRV